MPRIALVMWNRVVERQRGPKLSIIIAPVLGTCGEIRGGTCKKVL